MKRFIGYGKIGQFRDVLHDIKKEYGDNPLPTASCRYTEKIHGTNASVCFDGENFWVQSRKNIITPEKDNAGCAFWCYANKDAWTIIAERLTGLHGINRETHIITIYFEWCGGSVQKTSACSGLGKRAVIFNYCKVSPTEPILRADGGEEYEMLEAEYPDNMEEYDIFSAQEMYKREFALNFEDYADSINELRRVVLEDIEPHSPTGRYMGVADNIGEGIVVTCKIATKLYMFKVKGEKHSESKVKTLKPIDGVAEKAKIEFANYACTSSRLEQAWQETFGIENEKLEPTIKATGDFLRWLFGDIIKEESDVMLKMGVEPKSVNGNIAKIARRWFMEQLNKGEIE
jgi:hypothetical protein